MHQKFTIDIENDREISKTELGRAIEKEIAPWNILNIVEETLKSNCDDCYWDISEKECHMQGKHKIADGTCDRYRKSDNKGAIQRDEAGRIIYR